MNSGGNSTGLSPNALVTDLDGTALRKTLAQEVLRRLHAIGLLQLADYADIVALELAWRERRGPFHASHKRHIELVHGGLLEQISYADFQLVCQGVARDFAAHAYVFTRELVLAAKTLGYRVFAVSGSMEEVVGPLCEIWGIEDHLSTKMPRREEGKFLDAGYDHPGQPVWDKGQAVRQLLAKHGYQSSEDLANLVVIGDTMSDAKMLQIATHAIAFNPAADLRDLAASSRWALVDERRELVELRRGEGPGGWFQRATLVDILPQTLAEQLQQRLAVCHHAVR